MDLPLLNRLIHGAQRIATDKQQCYTEREQQAIITALLLKALEDIKPEYIRDILLNRPQR